MQNVLLVTPPFTQFNTPYPATTQLKAFLESEGYACEQRDLGIEVAAEVFSAEFLSAAFPPGHPAGRDYSAVIDSVMRFLRGDDDTLAMRIVNGSLLPDGDWGGSDEDMEWSFGVAGTHDKARYMATRFLEAVAEALRTYVDPHFEMVRYGERISTYAERFDELSAALAKPLTRIEDVMLRKLEVYIAQVRPTVVGFTIPFPGCLLSALRCAQFLKREYADIVVVFGGGFPNTEWRQLDTPALFDYADYVTLDDGELPLLRLLRYKEGLLDKQQLLRTYFRENGRVRYIDDRQSDMPVQVRNDALPVPDFGGLPLHSYLSLADMANPMQRLWSCGRWNKLMMAHGCYWAKCAFCDTTLDYIQRYDAPRAATVVDRMERIMQQTGCSGFHFVDEAIPPRLLGEVCQEILHRRLTVSFWGNIRFEKRYDTALCRLMADAGCIAVSGGLEVASDRLLQWIGKGVTVQQTMQAARHFRDAGIMVHTYLMYGFPTETLEETIEALDNVRRMFAEGSLQSAFWHRYAMTVHSDSGQHPEKYGARRRAGETPHPFCNNEIPFEAPFNYDLDAVGDALRVATYNYMNGLGLDMPVRKWFRDLLRPEAPHRKKR